MLKVQILTQQVLYGAYFFVFLKCSQVMLVCCFTLSKRLIPISHIPWLQMEASREIFKVTDTYSHTDNWMKFLMWGPGINIFKVTRWCENEVTIENSCLRWYLFLFKLYNDPSRQDVLRKIMCSTGKWDNPSTTGDWVRKWIIFRIVNSH